MKNRKRLIAFFRLLAVFVALGIAAPVEAQESDRDSDKDGLSDFHEKYKYFTDPNKADSDNDGRPDGDWLERREYQYTIRSVVQVMRPVTIEYLNDDYQDARILDETDDFVELEVIHYPFNKVAEAIKPNQRWQKEKMAIRKANNKWLQPGPTSDWDEDFRKQLAEDLKQDGIDLAALNDQETAERVSKWLLKRASYQDGFSTFITAFDENGKPYLPEDLKNAPDRTRGLTVQEQWECEISAQGMYKTKKRGSCSSSAIYLSGCLRAAELPTRTILCIPIIDANDEREMEMVNRLQHPGVRRDLLLALRPLKGKWASHTFNEVLVGGRWRRLNYDRLGQNIYDRGMFGLMTHVATFRDWADAKMPETIGRRQRGNQKDVFGGPNPYSTISLRDSFGVHCKIEKPKPLKLTLSVDEIYWTDSKKLSEDIRENCRRRGRFGLIAKVTGFQDTNQVPEFLESADLRVYLVPTQSPADSAVEPNRLGIGFDPNCYWLGKDSLMIYIPFGRGDQRDLVTGIKYAFQTRNQSENCRWKSGGLEIKREDK